MSESQKNFYVFYQKLRDMKTNEFHAAIQCYENHRNYLLNINLIRVTVNIKIIIGSVRQGRIGPQIANWAYNNIKNVGTDINAEIIDLSLWYLPMDDEPHLPATGKYLQPHTKLWSEKVAEGEMFIFIFPQYNWGYPAALKNAIDHLYNEWKDKPALIISYANRGGGKASTQFRQVLEGIHMQPLSTAVEIKLSELTFDNQGQIECCEVSLEKYNNLINKAVNEAWSISRS